MLHRSLSMFAILSLASFVCLALSSCSSAQVNLAPVSKSHIADVVVYGDASGGVTAAIQASRMGKKVILISPYHQFGGLTSNGLGWTDIGNSKILGGLAREFYAHVYDYYQDDAAWVQEKRENFHNRSQSREPALNPKTKLASTFEPKVAERVFYSMLLEAKVKVIQGSIDLERGVIKKAQRIQAIRLENGMEIQGKMFIDASYEGDLLAMAGVSYTIGRESNAKYNEKGNGFTGPLRGNQLPKGIDPYVIKGDRSSGLLPGVNPRLQSQVGDGDHRLQAYCFRMVLTDVPSNRVPILKPKDYNEADYELLFRAFEQGYRQAIFKTTMVPNRKTDSNNTGGISCDYIGGNYGLGWNWATLSHSERRVLADKHRDWQLGLVWTVQNHPRVPERVRKYYAKWGLAKDEFTDNGHWPYRLYVREARRMVSDYVMTENHCRNKIAVEDPIALGAYTLDSHNVQRYVYKGMVQNEGDIQRSLKRRPYGISYRSIVPKQDECENLLVPWALSASHIAFGSIRMEPVFMILGQSAATSACLAIDQNISVQKVQYAELRKQLLKDGQRLGMDK